MLLGQTPINATQYEASLERFMRAPVVKDAELLDYHLQQAFRSLAYTAIDTAVHYPVARSGPLEEQKERGAEGVHEKGAMQEAAPGLRTVRGREALWYQMCRRAHCSASSLQTLLFLSSKLLCDDATSFGEGNEKPFAGDSWAIALLLYGISDRNEDLKTKAFHSMESVDRRYLLGHLLLSLGTLRLVTTQKNGITSKRVFESYPQLGEGWFDLLLPRVAMLADERSATLRPALLVAEANNFIIHSFFHLTNDILVVHAESSAQEEKRPRLLDRDPPQHMWAVLGTLQRAFARASGWLRAELEYWQTASAETSRIPTENTVKDQRRRPLTHLSVDFKFLDQVSRCLENCLSKLIREQEEMHCLRQNVKETFGDNASDYHRMSEVMWQHTLRGCFAVRYWTESYIRSLGGVAVFAAGAPHGIPSPTPKGILQFVGSCVSQIPPVQEDKPSEVQIFTAQVVLLAASGAVAFFASLRSMQRALWSADLELTKHIQLVVSQQGLHYVDPVVVQLSSLLLGSIWTISVDSPVSSDFLSSTSDQLLDLLRQDRDAASSCVVELVSRAAVDRPHHFIPSLFRLLEHGSQSARRNAMDVLAALPQMTVEESETLMHGASTALQRADSRPDKMAVLLRTLAQHLLMHVQDEELCVRLQNAALFSRVSPDDVMQPLLNLSLQPDSTGRRYSSIHAALTSVITAHTSNANTLVQLLGRCFDTLSALKSETAQSSPSGVSVSKAPQTPGDVLPYAMLYSTEAVSPNPPEPLPNTDSSVALKGKEDRLYTLFQQLAKQWVNGVATWDAEQHVVPLLNAALSTPSEDQWRQQWATKAVLGVLDSISCAAHPEAEKSVIRALSPYFAVIPASSGLPQGRFPPSKWLGEWLSIGRLPEEAWQTLLFHASFPLLCVRRCISHWKSIRPPETAAIPFSSEGREIWESIWIALTHPEFEVTAKRLPEFTVVQVEILTHFDPLLFYAHWNKSNSVALEWDEKSSQAVRSHGTLYLQWLYCLFFTRSLVRTRFSELFNDGASSHSTFFMDDGKVKEWLEVPMNSLASVVMPWLGTDEPGTCLSPAADLPVRKLCSGICELVAALMMFGLLPSSTPARCSPVWWEDINTIVFHPLREVCTLYRSISDPQSTVPQTDKSSCCEKDVLERFLLAMNVHEGFVQHFQMNPFAVQVLSTYINIMTPLLMDAGNASAQLLRLQKAQECEVAVQCGMLLFKMVMLSSKVPADAVAAYADRDPSIPSQPETHPEDHSSEITTLSAPAASSHPHRGAVPQTLLEILGETTVRAFASFALGCLRFTKSIALQDVGVKLFSALIGVVPDLVVSSDEELLFSAVTALQGIARLHPTAATRKVAEYVLQFLPADLN